MKNIENEPFDDEEMPLTLHIYDNLTRMEYFDVGQEYHDAEEFQQQDEGCNFYKNVCVSVTAGREVVAYMECYLFNDGIISDSGGNHILYADEISQDAYNAMCALKKFGHLKPRKDMALDYLMAAYSDVTVYLRYIAVREDFRKKGIASWLLRNQCSIISRVYGSSSRVVITSLFPQDIKWDGDVPKFDPRIDEAAETPESKQMYQAMKQLFVKNGYVQLGDTEHFVKERERHDDFND